jgi:hypothetical protein
MIKKKTGRPKKPDKDKAKYNDKMRCEMCNVSVSRSNLSTHKKSKIHLERNKIKELINNLFCEHIKTDKSKLKDRLKTCFINYNGDAIYLNKKQYEYILKVSN